MAPQMPRPAVPAGRARYLAALVPVALLLGLAPAGPAGCSSKTVLIPTPTLNLTPQGKSAFEALAAEQRTPEMDILYAADRSVARRTVLGIEYGTGRSGVLTIGTARVAFDPPVSWD
jgi:hypothetical protein